MDEIKVSEISEIKKVESENYKDIKSQKGTTADMARKFWNNEFKNNEKYYNSYEERIGHTPRQETSLGMWEGERGNSKFKPSNETIEGKLASGKLAEKGLDGIEYKNAEPDFSKCSETVVEIDDMTQHRENYFGENGTVKLGNFAQADMKCADKWNAELRNGKNDWQARDVYNWRHENKYSWHERCDTRTMDLIPFEIHSYCKHLGGVSECKIRDSIDFGGDFDE